MTTGRFVGLPNFLVIGTQKAGTTWLAETLAQHPDVFVAPHEIHFFDKEQNFARGTAWYEQHFARARGERAVGEKTPDYFWPEGHGFGGHVPGVHRRIRDVLGPEVRLVVVLRNPVERAISAARHLVKDGWVSPLSRLDDLLIGSQRETGAAHGLLEYGRYADHLAAYLEVFDRERILVLVYEEDVSEEPLRGLRRVTEFLEVDSAFPFVGLHERRNEFRKSWARLLVEAHLPLGRRVALHLDRVFPAARYQVRAETRERIRALYAADNERLFDLLGRRIESWLG